MQRCRVALYLPTRCRVPSSAHDLPRLSPVGTKPDAHRIGSRAPLGLALRAAELQVCIPMVCPIPQTAGRTLPAYPFPLAGRLSVSLHTLVHGRLTVGVKRQEGRKSDRRTSVVSSKKTPGALCSMLATYPPRRVHGSLRSFSELTLHTGHSAQGSPTSTNPYHLVYTPGGPRPFSTANPACPT